MPAKDFSSLDKARDFQNKKYNLLNLLFIATAVLLLMLPFITTFNEFLTSLAEKFYFFRLIEQLMVPFEAKWVVGLLSIFGLEAVATPGSIMIPQESGMGLEVFISWNCIGWQSLILLIVTFLVMLQGVGSFFQKFNVILFGLVGTFWINLLRITSVILFAKYWGMAPAIIFHDYAGNILILVWLFSFWLISFRFLLSKNKD